MKTFKLSTLALLGLGALGLNTLQAQISGLPFELNDVQSFSIALTGVTQTTNYTTATSTSTNDVAKTKSWKLNNAGFLGLLGQAYFGDNNHFAKLGKTNYQAQIYLVSTNYYSDTYTSARWNLQVVQVAGTNKTIVLDTGTAAAFTPAGASGARAYFELHTDNGPISGKVTEGKSVSILQTDFAWFEFRYYYSTDPGTQQPFDIYGQGVMYQNYSGNSNGEKASFRINNISGENFVETNGAITIDSILTSGSITGSGKYPHND